LLGAPVLLELVEQLPVVPVTCEDVLLDPDDELPLQLNAFATFVIIVGGDRIIANTLALEMTIAINTATLIIHGIAHGHL
jgi:hypothetical protein